LPGINFDITYLLHRHQSNGKEGTIKRQGKQGKYERINSTYVRLNSTIGWGGGI
jgi:hypothetical protein